VRSRRGDLRIECGYYTEQGEHVVTAVASPRVFWVGADPATQQLVRRWPVGSALVETLGDLNSEVQAALAGERARLNYHGYAEDFPLPALWWTSRA